MNAFGIEEKTVTVTAADVADQTGYSENLPLSESLRDAGEKVRLMRLGISFADGKVVAAPSGVSFENVISAKGRKSFVLTGGDFGVDGRVWDERFALADENMSEKHTFAETP